LPPAKPNIKISAVFAPTQGGSEAYANLTGQHKVNPEAIKSRTFSPDIKHPSSAKDIGCDEKRKDSQGNGILRYYIMAKKK
jgi:hypothetical protein